MPELPATNTGKFISFAGSIFSYLIVAVLSAILTTRLSFDLVPGKQITSFADVDLNGLPLCSEWNHVPTRLLLARSAPKGLKVVERSVADCIRAVADGRAQAYIADEAVARWCAAPADNSVSPLCAGSALAIVPACSEGWAR